jgi:hypothetical protein
MLPLVKALQKADLYSKSREIPSMEEARAYYDTLIHKYLGEEPLTW